MHKKKLVLSKAVELVDVMSRGFKRWNFSRDLSLVTTQPIVWLDPQRRQQKQHARNWCCRYIQTRAGTICNQGNRTLQRVECRL